MKIAGIILIIISFSYIGYVLGEKQLSVLKEIERTDKILKNIILGLKDKKKTVFEIFDEIKAFSDKETIDFLNSIYKNNGTSIEQKAKETGFCYSSSITSVLEDIFSVLGKYTSDEQISELEFCREKLKNKYSEIKGPAFEKAKLYKYSGILSGIFTAVLFI